MTSEIRANTLKNRVGLGTVSFTNTGPVVSGIVTIANSTAAGVTLEDNAGVGNSLKITTPTGYVSIGSGNSTFVHLQTDRGVFYFQKRIFVDEGIIGSYDENLILQSPSNTTRITINKDTGLVSIVNDLDVSGTTTLSDDLNVDSGTLFVDVSSNRIGINQTSPSTNLDVVGGAAISGGLTVGATLTASGTCNLGQTVTLTGTNPKLQFIDTNHNSDYSIYGSNGRFTVYDDTNSAERFRINSTGKITHTYDGTAYDAQYGQFEITKNGASNADPDWSYLSFHRAGQIGWQQGIDSNHFVIATTGGGAKNTLDAEKLRITSNGNLLLGTTSDTQRLHVYNSNGAAGYKTALFNSNDTANGTRIVFANTGNTSGRGLGINVGGQTYGPGQNKASFGWYNTDNTFATHHSIMTITSDAKIGINQTAPQTGLHINQDWVSNYGSISAEGSNNALVGLGLRSSGTYRAALIWRDGSSGDYLELATHSASNPILFKPNNTERVRVQDGGLRMNGGAYIMEVTAGSGAPNNANRQMDQRRWMWYGTSSSTHTVARVAKASSGQPGDGDSKLAAWIVTYTARTMYGFNSDGGYSVMKMRTGRFDYDDNTVRFSTEQDTLGTGGGSQNPTIVFTDEGSGVVRISITNPSSTHSFGEINLMTYDCRITLPSG